MMNRLVTFQQRYNISCIYTCTWPIGDLSYFMTFAHNIIYYYDGPESGTNA